MAERLLTISIRNYLVKQPRTKRARKAVAYIRERVAHFTKIKEENIKIGYTLNNLIFKHYSRRMTPVKLRVKIGTDTADVLHFDEKPKAEEKKQEKKPLIALEKEEKKHTEVVKKQEPAATPAKQEKPHATPATTKK